MPIDYHQIRMTHTSEAAARVQATGLMTAKFIEMATGNKEPLFESINKLMNDEVELLGGTLLTILNLFVMFVSDNGQNMEAFQDMCNFLVDSLMDDSPQVRRIANGR